MVAFCLHVLDNSLHCVMFSSAYFFDSNYLSIIIIISIIVVELFIKICNILFLYFLVHYIYVINSAVT